MKRVRRIRCVGCGWTSSEEPEPTDIPALVKTHLGECPDVYWSDPIFGFTARWKLWPEDDDTTTLEIGWHAGPWGAPLHLHLGRDFLIAPPKS